MALVAAAAATPVNTQPTSATTTAVARQRVSTFTVTSLPSSRALRLSPTRLVAHGGDRRGTRTGCGEYDDAAARHHGVMPSRPQWVDAAGTLVSELWTVRTKSIKDLREDPADSVPTLTRFAEELLDVPKEKFKRQKLFTLLNAALPYLEADNQRSAASALFDLTMGYHIRPLVERQGKAAQAIGGRAKSAEAFSDNREKGGQHEQRLINAVADAIVTLVERLSVPRLRLIDGATRNTHSEIPYLERPEISHLFYVAVSENRRAILFTGDKGVGKSRLAQELCQRAKTPSEKVRFISQSDGRFSGDSLSDPLADSHLMPFSYMGRYPSDDELIAKYSEMLASGDAPKYLIIDNVTDFEEINRLTRLGTRSTLVMTSTLRASGTYVIHVPPFTDEEALEFTKMIVAHIPATELRELIATCGNRPQVIVQACMQLVERKQPPEAIGGIKRTIEFSPRLFFEMAEPSWQNRVTTYYAQLLHRLRTEQPTAATLLSILSLSRLEAESKLIAILAGVLSMDDETVASLSFTQAVARLKESNVITQPYKEIIQLNTITRIVVRDMLDANDDGLLDNVYSFVDTKLGRASRWGDPSMFAFWHDIWAAFVPSRNPTWHSIRHADPRRRPERPDGGVMASPLVPPSTFSDRVSTEIAEYLAQVERVFADLNAVNSVVAESLSGQ